MFFGNMFGKWGRKIGVGIDITGIGMKIGIDTIGIGIDIIGIGIDITGIGIDTNIIRVGIWIDIGDGYNFWN